MAKAGAYLDHLTFVLIVIVLVLVVIKQLLDEVFVIPRIIKVEVRVKG